MGTNIKCLNKNPVPKAILAKGRSTKKSGRHFHRYFWLKNTIRYWYFNHLGLQYQLHAQLRTHSLLHAGLSSSSLAQVPRSIDIVNSPKNGQPCPSRKLPNVVSSGPGHVAKPILKALVLAALQCASMQLKSQESLLGQKVLGY